MMRICGLIMMFTVCFMHAGYTQYMMNPLVPDTATDYLGNFGGASYYQIESFGKDTSLSIFERKEIILKKVNYSNYPNFTFSLDGNFEYHYGHKRFLGEMRVYYNRDYFDNSNQGVVHTSDTISWVGFQHYWGNYTITGDNLVTIHITKYLPMGEDIHFTTTLEKEIIGEYKLVLKGGKYYLLKQ